MCLFGVKLPEHETQKNVAQEQTEWDGKCVSNYKKNKQTLALFPTHINTKLKFIALCIYVKNDINFFEVGSRTIPFPELN